MGGGFYAKCVARRKKRCSPEIWGGKSQIFGHFWSDIGLLLPLKVVRFRSDFLEIESDLICERPAKGSTQAGDFKFGIQ